MKEENKKARKVVVIQGSLFLVAFCQDKQHCAKQMHVENNLIVATNKIFYPNFSTNTNSI